MDYEGKIKCTQNIDKVANIYYHFVCIVDHGLCDGRLEIGVPYFDDVVENDPKSRISRSISPYKRSTFLTKKY
ncbi:hypothetical protein PFNF54_02987 [Plasmodium falciparum NF54]|uniref:Uncharacterized protein n=1 Tax=Plasmodium falciparum (isolate NF54) TaxID=5843 RepID=W7KET0_PLAFO|nr:hypothetical protein PFNF54_02987 [Plasmodium falciparum NF54]